jgi:hypothetical protein
MTSPLQMLRFRLWRWRLRRKGRYIFADEEIPQQDIDRAADLARARDWNSMQP